VNNLISIYSGTVGSSKSYHATHIGLDWLNSKRHVIANFPIKPPKNLRTKGQIKRWESNNNRWHFNEEITIQYLIAMSIENGWFGHESKCLLLIDEAGIMFNTRDWQTEKNTRTPWIKFLSQSRKFGYDIVFVAQSDKMIDKQIRGLVEYDVRHFKLNNSFFLSWLSLLKISLFMYNYKWYQTKLKGNIRIVKYSARIANRYDTMRTFNLEELADQIEKVYEGKIVPAAVLIQLSVWKQNIFDRNEALKNPMGLQETELIEEEQAG
jgi:zona occludens toxin